MRIQSDELSQGRQMRRTVDGQIKYDPVVDWLKFV